MDTMFVIPTYAGNLFGDIGVALVFDSEQEAQEFLETELPYASIENGAIGGRFFHNLVIVQDDSYYIETADGIVEEGNVYEAIVNANNLRDDVSAFIYSDKAFGKKTTVGEVISKNVFFY